MNVKPLFSRVSSAAIAIAIVAGTAPAIAAAAAPAAQQASANAWGIPVTDVTPDPAIRYGTLPNGMKYAIMHNGVPKGSAAVRLRFEFGSIGESDKEQGLAHFIEHMAFNGSTHVPEGDMVKILERQGLKFGPDTNAQTGFDSTTYMLDLPSTDAEHLDTSLMLMREVASEIKFDKGALDRERGVIEGERRFRETAPLHLAIDELQFNAPNTPYGKRLPIGTTEVINSVTPEAIKDLYHRYYRPENATLIFVGDADPAVIEAKIKEHFGSWAGVGPAGAKLPRGTVDLKRPADFDTFVDPSIPSIVQLTSYRPWEDPQDTKAERKNEVVRQLAMAMFNRRIDRIAHAPDSVILGGGMSLDKTRDAAVASVAGVVAKDGHWKDAVGIADQELRRAIQYGFLQSELDLARTNLTSQLAREAEQADSRKSASIAQEIVSDLDGHDLITSPAWDAKFVAEVAPRVTLAEVDKEFQKLWSGSARLVHVSAKEALSDEQVAAAVGASSKLAVAKPADEQVKAFAYDNLGTAGTIAEDSRIADLGVRTIRFANNVRLNIKKTDFEPGKVSFLVRMTGGTLAMPKDEPGLGALIANMSALAGTKKHNFEDLKTLTAGKQITAGFSVGEDAFETAGATTAADLPLQMKITAAYMTDPGYRTEAASQWATVVPLFDKQISAQPLQLLNVRLPYLLTGHDARFGLPPASDLIQRNLNEFKAVYAPASATAPIEITIVGDVDEKAAVDAIAKSFGALPKRRAEGGRLFRGPQDAVDGRRHSADPEAYGRGRPGGGRRRVADRRRQGFPHGDRADDGQQRPRPDADGLGPRAARRLLWRVGRFDHVVRLHPLRLSRRRRGRFADQGRRGREGDRRSRREASRQADRQGLADRALNPSSRSAAHPSRERLLAGRAPGRAVRARPSRPHPQADRDPQVDHSGGHPEARADLPDAGPMNRLA